jgi:hypothetical protein
MNSPLCV